MNLSFFGGASGIGASCLLLDTGRLRLVVDCGIRQGRGETLPDLGGLQAALQGRPPDAIVLTHAHLDHSGALPLLHQAWRQLPILCTRATAELLRILLLDAVKVMGMDRDEELPLYGQQQVESALAAVKPLAFDDPVAVGPGRISLLPAGHILGAASVLVEDGQRSVLVTGDISITNQATVPGMPRPRAQPVAVVVESTYGDKMHSSRRAEEQRLCAQVSAAVQRGGHVLVPAFAVGRAQEVLLALQGAMRRGLIPRFPVYADGMVRAVCGAYAHHPSFLAPALRRRAQKERDPFFPDDLEFQRVGSPAQRQAVMGGPPCCVVASSGMLAGGASPLYARAWAQEEASLIAITGYQDEEAPGRALLALADGSERQLRLPGGSVQLRCAVERYHLSAHADADQITGLVEALRPRSVWVVHGDQGAREALAARLDEATRARVHLPEDGGSYPVEGAVARQRPSWIGPGIGQGRPLDQAALRLVADLLLKGDPQGRRLRSVPEITRVWFGERASSDQVQQLRELLDAGSQAFEPDRGLAFRYRARPAPVERRGPAPPAELLRALERALPADSGLCKRSLHQEQCRAVLQFALPAVQGPAVAPVLEQLERDTGWKLEVHPHPRQDALQQAFSRLLPAGCVVTRGPSFHHDLSLVRATLAPLPGDLSELQRLFRERTGWELELQGEAAAPGEGGGEAPVQLLPGAEQHSPQETRSLLLEAFRDQPEHLRPLKTGYPPGRIRLHFVHPGIAERHREILARLERDTGRAVQVHPHPVHQRLLPLVQERIPPDWAVTGPPSWVAQRGHVRIAVWFFPSDQELADLRRELREALGCEVVVEAREG